MIYGGRSNGGEHGTVLTKREVTEFMLDLLDYKPSKNLSKIRILEPAAGEGVFLKEIVKRLFESSKKYNFDFQDSLSNIRVVEIDDNKVTILQRWLRKKLQDYGIANDDLINEIIINGDFLLTQVEKFDIIVGNPPYVRYDNIPKDLQKKYKRFFNSFQHRADLYIPFFEKGLDLLSESGKLCFICSNRWMKSQYGQNLRELISYSYGIPVIINLEDADAFEEKVHAYASITLITKKIENKIDYFQTQDIQDFGTILDILSGEKNNSDSLRYFRIPKPETSNWILDPELIEIHNHDFFTLEEQGFKIGIGVATGADSIFIGKELPELVEKEAILPLISGRDIIDGKIFWQGNYVINPYNGATNQLINLSTYPKLKNYLETNKEKLLKRHTAQKNPRKWYKTIDKIDITLINKPKLLLPDIKGSPYIALDEGEYYLHHNVYYILNHDKKNLKILGSLLMSDFVLKQIKIVSNIMNGGYPRWQAQNLRKIVIPKISELSERDKDNLEKYFDKKNLNQINDLVNTIIHKEKHHSIKPAPSI